MILSQQKKAIKELLNKKIETRQQLAAIKRKLSKKYKINILLNSDILKEYKNVKAIHELPKRISPLLDKILRKRSVRTMSGIAPVAVLTKPYPCPGRCIYCPHELNVPQSYLSNEPAVMRAIRCNYYPYKQVQLRLRALEANGHQPNKIELIVIGGTWSVLPKSYKYWFIKECFRAANEYNDKIPNPKAQSPNKFQIQNSKFQTNKLKNMLEGEQQKNEKAKYRIIGITLETRPDYIDEKEVREIRELGCTRVELGVQAIDDKILKLNKRGHGVQKIAQATKLLKNYGFKITYHIMPGLPGSSPKKDLLMFRQLFSDSRFQPDQIKFYPTVVTKNTLLYRWWKKGEYKPYSDNTLWKLIVACKKIVPSYVRIVRLIRDIPSESIMAGNIITNLRQVLKEQGVVCRCIRCREAKESKFSIFNFQFSIKKYKASDGEEYFISCESRDGKILYGFCRLRLAMKSDFRYPKSDFRKILEGAAMIRELHVYGELVPVGANKKIQHAGLGKKLMKEAEKIARQNDYKRMAVIAGVGVRNYYRKLGYRLINSYMIRTL